MSKISVYLLAFPFFLIFTSGVFASSVSLSNPNTYAIYDFTQNFEIDINLNIKTDDGTKYYLRGIFFESGINKYCGLTWNGQSWYGGPYTSGDGWKNLPTIMISSDSGNLRLKARLDPDDKDCNTEGEYNFKIQRYTESGSGSIDSQNEQKIKLYVSQPTPTQKPESTKSPTKMPSAVKTKSAPTSETPTLNPVDFRSPMAILPTLTAITINSGEIPETLPENFNIEYEDASFTAYETASVAGATTKKKINLLIFPLLVGLVLIFISSFLFYEKIKNFIDKPN